MAKTSVSDLVQDFLDESRMMGYEIRGTTFKARYNGKVWSVGFWIRPKKNRLTLPGRLGTARDPVLRKAVKKAIERAIERAKLSEEENL